MASWFAATSPSCSVLSIPTLSDICLLKKRSVKKCEAVYLEGGCPYLAEEFTGLHFYVIYVGYIKCM